MDFSQANVSATEQTASRIKMIRKKSYRIDASKPSHLRLFYFTKLEFALISLATLQLKVSRFNSLNDPFDLLGVALFDKENRIELKPLKKKLDKTTGLICMSESWNNPLMWGHYADNHQGACLEFQCAVSDWHKVQYRRTRPTLATFNRDSVAELSKTDLDELSLMKFEAWAYEKEYRTIIPLSDCKLKNGIHFQPFSDSMKLTRVLLGSRCKIGREEIHRHCRSAGPDIKLIKVRPAHQTFQVIENGLYKDRLPRPKKIALAL
jgi:hypothetical protein